MRWTAETVKRHPAGADPSWQIAHRALNASGVQQDVEIALVQVDGLCSPEVTKIGRSTDFSFVFTVACARTY